VIAIPSWRDESLRATVVVVVGVLLAAATGWWGWLFGAILFAVLATVLVMLQLAYRLTALVVACVLVLSVYPRARFLLGPVPLYWLDLLIAGGLAIAVWRARALGRAPHDAKPVGRLTTRLVLLLSVAYVPSFLWLLTLEESAAPLVYFLGRYWLNTWVFFLCLAALKRRADVEQALAALYVGTLVVSIWALFQGLPFLGAIGEELTAKVNSLFGYSSQSVSFSPHDVGGLTLNRVVGGYTIATVFGGFYALVLPLLLFVFTSRAAPKLWLPARLGLVLMSFGLLLTYSRGAFIAVAIGCIAALVVRSRDPGRLGAYIVRALAVLLAIVVGISFLAPQAGELAMRRMALILTPQDDPNIQARLDPIPRFFDALAEEPEILVRGQHPLILKLQRYEVFEDVAYRGFISNSWLLLLMEGGLPFFVLYALVYLVITGQLTRHIVARQRQGADVALPLGCLAAMVSAGVAHGVDNYMAGGGALYLRATYFFIAGLSVAVLRVASQPASPEVAGAPRRSRG
jgi:hypothetical protein